jgi:hypothetical protein
MLGPFTISKSSRRIFTAKYKNPFEREVAVWKRILTHANVAVNRSSALLSDEFTIVQNKFFTQAQRAKSQ